MAHGFAFGIEAAGVALILTGLSLSPVGCWLALVQLYGSPTFGSTVKFSRKGRKHIRIIQCFLNKRASIHRAVSEALRDSSVSAERI